MSETSKARHLVLPYVQGNGIDIGAGGDPVTPCALSIDLPPAEAERYTTTDHGVRPIQWRGDARNLRWFRDGVLDFAFSSHVIEDFAKVEQPHILAEWGRVVRQGGYLVVLYPECTLWARAVDAGQPMNHNHKHEPNGGEIADVLRKQGWEIVEDRLCSETDYGWMVVGRKR